jgi:mono/diheme cytochrome c family protein
VLDISPSSTDFSFPFRNRTFENQTGEASETGDEMVVHRLRTEILFVALAASVTMLSVAAPAHAQDAASIYSQRCVACHGASGKGDGPAGKYLTPKPSDFGTSLKGKDDAWISKAIKGGGAAVGESPVMPPYADLSDDQVKALVDYVKHFGS